MSRKKLTDFKALLFDIDRTLTDTSGKISDETLLALKKISSLKNSSGQNFQIGVCSGRGIASIKNKILPLFPKNSLHITGGGSQLVNSKGKIVWEHTINPESIKKLRKYLDNSEKLDNKKTNSKPMAVFMREDAQYTKDPILVNLKKHPWKPIVKNLDTMNNNGVGLIYLTNLNNEIINYIKNDPNFSFKQMTSNYGNAYIDITAKGVNKSIALETWSQQMKIPTKEIIGFGDSLNDIEFLKTCGYSIAMGNAITKVKQISNRVIGHTNDNALAKYLTKIIQGENL